MQTSYSIVTVVVRPRTDIPRNGEAYRIPPLHKPFEPVMHYTRIPMVQEVHRSVLVLRHVHRRFVKREGSLADSKVPEGILRCATHVSVN